MTLYVYFFFFSFLLVVSLPSSASSINPHQIAVHIPGGRTKAQNVANRSGFKLQGPIGSLEDHFIFLHHPTSEEKRLKRSIGGRKSRERKLRKDPRVKWMRKQKPLRRVKRSIIASMPTDPLFKDQWYLNEGAVDGSDMNVEAAWNLGYTGKGVVVTILDDGIQHNHPDLIPSNNHSYLIPSNNHSHLIPSKYHSDLITFETD